MVELNPKWVEFILPFINYSPIFKSQNMKVIDLKYGESFLELEIKRKHLQAYGTVHGGIYGVLIDSAGWWAVFTQVEGIKNAVTADMNVNYLASAKSGKLLAYGRVIRVGKKLGLAEASIKNEEGKLLAHGTVTVMVTGPYEHPLMEKMPPKLL